jgi:acylphosphatase
MKSLSPRHDFETISVRITGRVQGVGFRIAAVRRAHMLGVTGWVRNAADGAVEALLQGSVDAVDQMLSWLHQGPPGARVAEVTHEQQFVERRYDRFEQQ